MNKIKILLIANMYPTKKDPTFGTFIKVFDEGLSTYRNEYIIERILIKGRSKNIVVKLCKYVIFYIKLLFYLIFKNYNFIYVHTITFPTPPIRFVSFFKKLNLIFNVHGADVLTKSQLAKILKNMSRPLLSKAKYIVVPSKYFEDVIMLEFPELDKNKIVVSASGGIEKAFFSERKTYSHKTLRIGYVSRLTKGKGWSILLDALMILKKKNINFKATFVGFGEDCNKLLNIIHSNIYDGKVQYIGPLGHDKLPDFYKSIDLFIFPSNYNESLGLVGLEAMAASIPVIGSNIGGISTYVRDGINGFLFTPGDAVGLADNIIKFINMNESLRIKMMQSAYETATEYETSVVLEKLFNVIFPIKE